MSAKFTPGPWEVWKDEEGQFGVVDKTGFFVTFAFPIDGDGSGEVQGKNAVLIAAAPELLAATQACLAVFDEACAKWPDNPVGAKTQAAMDAARAAIAKAEAR